MFEQYVDAPVQVSEIRVCKFIDPETGEVLWRTECGRGTSTGKALFSVEQPLYRFPIPVALELLDAGAVPCAQKVVKAVYFG